MHTTSQCFDAVDGPVHVLCPNPAGPVGCLSADPSNGYPQSRPAIATLVERSPRKLLVHMLGNHRPGLRRGTHQGHGSTAGCVAEIADLGPGSAPIGPSTGPRMTGQPSRRCSTDATNQSCRGCYEATGPPGPSRIGVGGGQSDVPAVACLRGSPSPERGVRHTGSSIACRWLRRNLGTGNTPPGICTGNQRSKAHRGT